MITYSTDTLHPSLGLLTRYCFSNANDSVTLNVDSIYNPRESDNLSGTLSLELWALPTAYNGEDFQGHPLAGVCIGCLGGQQNWANLSYTLPLSTPPSGTWIITLMLREWTGLGYTTRSHANFPQPVNFPFTDNTPAPAPIVELKPASPTPVAKLIQPKSTTTKAKATAPKVIEPKAVPSKTPTKAPAKATTEKKLVSINKATASELAAIDGISSAIAKSIVAARPIAKMEDLLKVKGVTAKLLAKFQPHIRID